MKKLIFAAAALVGSAGCYSGSAVAAQVIPVGVQNDVSIATIQSWGWSEIYRGNYGANVNLSTAFSGAGSHVLVGATFGTSGILDVFAATTLADALQYTAYSATHLSNGANWYSNGYSFGFAGATDTIVQSTADTSGFGERDRLSWHTSVVDASSLGPNQWTQDVNLPAVSFGSGWRSGSNTGIYSGTQWQRVIFTLTPTDSAVPEPATWIMMLLGFGVIGAAMRRRERQTVRYDFA